MCKCKKMLQKYVDWCKQPVSNSSYQKYFVDFNIVTIEPGNFFTSYCNTDPQGAEISKGSASGGILSFSSNSFPTDTPRLFLSANGKFLEGTGKQMFSDRSITVQVPSNPSSGGIDLKPSKTYRFNPEKADNLGIRIDIETGQTIFTLLSWGGGQSKADLRCANGVLYGFFDGGVPGVMITLRRAQWTYKEIVIN